MLPNTYNRLDYIESTGTQYILTNVSGSDNLRFVVDITAKGNGFSGNALIGLCNHSDTGYKVDVTRNSSNKYSYYATDTSYPLASAVNDGVRTTLTFETDTDSQSLTCNGETASSTKTTGNIDYIYLFAFFSGNDYYGNHRVHSVKIYMDNVLVRDYIPAKRISDGEIGLYDLENDVFYTNQGTGTFDYEYYVSVIVNDATLGSASFNSNTSVLTATPNSNAEFLGWYVNSVKISGDLSYTYTPTSEVTVEARFEPIYVVTTSVVGNGAIQVTRGSDQNDITVTVIPDANWHLNKYVVGTSEYTTTPLQMHLSANISIVAYFEEDDKFHISCPTGNDNITVYISDNDVYSGTQVTLWARPFPDYNFVRWGDGETTNPRQITVTENVTLTAEYQRVTDTNGIYQYRAFVKDQLNLEDPPKAFMIVETTDIKRDLMTNAVTSLTVKEIATNIDEGDVLVIYDPFGTTLYSGVITSIEEKQIRCSQMQSFYKGLWIYNVSPQDYLEHEIAVLLQDYADGKIYKSTYTDPLVALRLGGITIDYVGATTVNLPTDLDKDNKEQLTQKDMEKWMYELYETYGIIFDFEINFSGTNYVTIKIPTYTKLKVGDNMFAIKDVSPITEIEETNRLIIFDEKKVYRTTYVATKTNIVEAPASTATRFNITNTKVVFSKDAVADLVAANLPDQMYNHKLTFTLVIKNFIYQFGDFNLGGGIDVFNGDEYFDTVLTGYEFKKEDNSNITEVYFTCGKVRNKLTQLITLSKV